MAKERDKAGGRERDRHRDRDRDRDLEWERHVGKDQRRDRAQDYMGERAGGRDRERSRDRGLSGDRHGERDRQRQKNKDRPQARTRSKERGLDVDYLEQGPSRDWPREGRASWEEEEDDGERERRARGRQRVHSGPEEVFDEPRSDEGRGWTGELWDPQQGEGPGRERIHTYPSGETGTTLRLPLGSAGGVCVVCWSCFFAMAISGGGLIYCSMAITNEDANFLSSHKDNEGLISDD